MVRSIAAIAASAALIALSAGPASAATRYVDDDGAQCPTAAYTSIQAAVDASGPGDVVRACGGTYAEQVVLPEDKADLQLRSVPARAARLVAPPGGLAHLDQPFDPDLEELVAVLGERQLVRDLRIDGPLTGPCPAEPPAAIGVYGDRARVDGNHIDVTGSDCADNGRTGILVFVRGIAFVDRNVVTHGDVGLDIVTGGQGSDFLRNDLTGASPSGGTGIRLHGSDLRVHGNDATGFATGVDAFESGRSKVYGNVLRGNGDAISLGIDLFDLEVRNNIVRNSLDDGIVLRPLPLTGDTRTALIRRNDVRGSGGDGISVQASPQDGFVRFFDNRSTGSGGFDCLDQTNGSGTAGTDNLWRGNKGVTDSPNVCVKP